MKDCSHTKKRASLNRTGEWRNLEKRNRALTELVKQFPVFTRIYKENLLLKQDPRGEGTPALKEFQKAGGTPALKEFQKAEAPTKRTIEENSTLIARQSSNLPTLEAASG